MTELIAALAGAVVGAVLGGIFQDLWAVRRARLRGAALALSSLNRSRFELVRVHVLLEQADREMLASADSWIALRLPPRVLESSRHISEDLPTRITQLLAECDDAVTKAEESAARALPAIAKSAAALSFGSDSGYRVVRSAMVHDLATAVDTLRRGIRELEQYHRGLSDLQDTGD